MRLEHWLYTIPLRLRSLFRRKRIEDELEEELQFHLAQRTETEIAQGKDAEEARYTALRAMEGIAQRKEECRDARRVRWLEDLLRDAKYAIRTLRKSPGFTAIATLVLALGIGANTAVFTIVNKVLLQPAPFPNPERLFLVSNKPRNLIFNLGPVMLDSDYLDFRRHNRSFEYLTTITAKKMTLTGSGDPVVLTAGETGADFLRVLGVHPSIGRDFLPDGQEETNVIILGNPIWKSRFDSNPNIIGTSITLDGLLYRVVGVMPPNFRFQHADLWMCREITLNPHNTFLLPVIGRLRLNVSPQQAEAELLTFAANHPGDPKAHWNGFITEILPLKELFVAHIRKLLLIFTGAVAFVFLIACANFANLLLIRNAGRQPEIAVRAALGAGRWRLVRQMMAENMLLSLLGALMGVLLSVVGVRALLALLPPESIPFAETIGLDGWVLGFTLGLSLITGIVFGLAPAMQATRRELREGINEGGRSILRRREQTRSVLVAAEIALALVLLTGAGLLLKSFIKMQTLDRGFRSAGIITATVDLPKSRYRTALQMRLLDQQVLSSLSLLPGAKSVASVSYLPFGWGVRGDFQLEDGRQIQHGFYVDKPVVSAGYFRTMDIRLISGRDFTEHDSAGAPGVVIISQSVARRLWPDGDAVGKRISMADHPKPNDWLTIVGVVDDVRQGILTDSPSTTIYLPYLQVNEPGFLKHMSFVVQKSNRSTAMASAIQAVIRDADPSLPTQSILSMDAIMAESMSEPRSQTRLLGIFSILALLLAAIGIYGVLACSVVERTHEIGVRMAVGAAQSDVIRMVLHRTIMLAAGGVFIGVIGALMITRVLEKFLFDVKSTDPATFMAVTAILIGVALLAAWIPAYRASRISPSDALRHE